MFCLAESYLLHVLHAHVEAQRFTERSSTELAEDRLDSDSLIDALSALPTRLSLKWEKSNSIAAALDPVGSAPLSDLNDADFVYTCAILRGSGV